MVHSGQGLVALVVLPYRAEQEVHPWLALVALVACRAEQVVRPSKALVALEALEALVVLPCRAEQVVHPSEVQEEHPCLAVREALAA